eukprot:tig00020675_g12674.t1
MDPAQRQPRVRRQAGGSTASADAPAKTDRTAGTSAASSSTPAPKSPEHLFVFVHGLHGLPSDFAYIERKLLERTGGRADVLSVTSNCMRIHWNYFRTHDGVDGGGERVAEEIRAYVDAHPDLKRISVVGHSLGGLYARYALGRLYDPASGTFCGRLQPATGRPAGRGAHAPREDVPHRDYVSFVSPHLGVRGVIHPLLQFLASLLLQRTGRQLLLDDSDGYGGEPLLVSLARDSQLGPFLSALSSFRSRVCYATIAYDVQVPYPTSAISAYPFSEGDAGEPAEGYPTVAGVRRGPLWPPAGEAAAGSPESRRRFFEGSEPRHARAFEAMLSGLGLREWTRVALRMGPLLSRLFAHTSVISKFPEALNGSARDVVDHFLACCVDPEPPAAAARSGAPASCLSAGATIAG